MKSTHAKERNIFDSGKLYTAKAIIEKTGYRNFQDLEASGRIEWTQDNTQGQKLYRLKT
jgi:hypothetical protein